MKTAITNMDAVDVLEYITRITSNILQCQTSHLFVVDYKNREVILFSFCSPFFFFFALLELFQKSSRVF